MALADTRGEADQRERDRRRGRGVGLGMEGGRGGGRVSERIMEVNLKKKGVSIT